MQIPEFNDEQDRQRAMNHRDSECPKHLVRKEEDQEPDAQEDIDEILDKDPREPTALGILGVEAFDDGRYEQAINYWRRALAGFGDNESAQAMRNGIAVARQRLEETANGAERVTD